MAERLQRLGAHRERFAAAIRQQSTPSTVMLTAEIRTYARELTLPRFGPLAPVGSRILPVTFSELMTGVGP